MGPPAGYVAYGGSGAVNRRVMRIGGLSKALIVLLAIYIPLSLIGIAATVRLAHRARDFVDGDISADSFRDSSRSIGGSVGGILVLAIAPLTIIWMFRIAQNLRIIGRPALRFAPGWAIGGWFTPPCVLYVVPWLMFRELWKASEPGLEPGNASWRQAKVSPIVEVWWVLYGLVPLIGLFTSAGLISQLRNGGSSSDARLRTLAKQLDSHLALNVVVAILGTLAAVAYLLLVLQLSRRHRQATGET
jgi:hypothetical protein